MELRDYLNLARTWWWLLLACTLAGGLTAFLAKSQQSSTYEARATVLVNQVETPGTLGYNDVLMSERLAETYRRMVESRPVLEDAQRTLQVEGGVDELASRIDATRIADTQLIQVSGRSEDPDTAARMVNAVLDAVVARNAAGQFGTRNSLSPVERAIAPTRPSDAGAIPATALGLIAGAVLAAGAVLVIEHLDDRVRDPDRLRGLEVSLLGTIRRVRSKGARLLDRQDPEAPTLEEYRVVRTAVQFALLDRPWRSLFITSAVAGEGKTTIAANLALVAAQAGQRVIVVDGDLRRPALHQAFGLDNRHGLTDLLLRTNAPLNDYLQDAGVENCRVLTSGPLPPNPDSVLASSRLREVIEEIGRSADMVVVDGPPVLPVAYAGYLANMADATILVVNARRTRRAPAARALAALQHASAHVVGAILNQTAAGEAYGYYGYRQRRQATKVRAGANGAIPASAEQAPMSPTQRAAKTRRAKRTRVSPREVGTPRE